MCRFHLKCSYFSNEHLLVLDAKMFIITLRTSEKHGLLIMRESKSNYLWHGGQRLSWKELRCKLPLYQQCWVQRRLRKPQPPLQLLYFQKGEEGNHAVISVLRLSEGLAVEYFSGIFSGIFTGARTAQAMPLGRKQQGWDLSIGFPLPICNVAISVCWSQISRC